MSRTGCGSSAAACGRELGSAAAAGHGLQYHVDEHRAVASPQRESSTFSTVTGAGRGPGNGRTSRSSVLRLTGIRNTSDKLAPARPASASSISSNMPRNSGLRRACRPVSPRTCSKNVRAPHRLVIAEQATHPQPRHRCPTRQRGIIKPSLVRLCTRSDSAPHRGHFPLRAALRARRITRSPRRCTRSTTTPRQCGSATHTDRSRSHSQGDCCGHCLTTAGHALQRSRYLSQIQNSTGVDKQPRTPAHDSGAAPSHVQPDGQRTQRAPPARRRTANKSEISTYAHGSMLEYVHQIEGS